MQTTKEDSTKDSNPGRGAQLSIVYRPLASLRPYAGNARTHTKSQIRKIGRSIAEFGFANPILIQKNGTIIAGHGRVEAAKQLKMPEVPTICLEDLNEEQVRAYVIADNRLAELAGWDEGLLRIELQHLLDLDLSFDVTLTGFDVAEIDMIVNADASKADKDDVFDTPGDGVAVSRLGDLWLLGRHRILCGSSLDDTSFVSLMNNAFASAVFVDPPYNVKIDGHATGNGTVRHREFAMASGEMSEEEFTAFLRRGFFLLHRYSHPGSMHFLCMDWRHMGELLAATGPVYDEQLGLCVWAKDSAGMGSLYRSQHELIFVFKKEGAPHRNNIMLGKYGRNRTNVWQYPCARSFSKQGEEGDLLNLHPTVKPVALVSDAILDCTAPGEIILDSFLGSGSTLIAAERVGRVCRGIEIDPLYVDLAISRWQAHTGERAVHAETACSFGELAERRNSHGRRAEGL